MSQLIGEGVADGAGMTGRPVDEAEAVVEARVLVPVVGSATRSG